MFVKNAMVYGYIRVSSDKQNVEVQRFEIISFCKKNSLSVDGWIQETVSGEWKNYKYVVTLKYKEFSSSVVRNVSFYFNYPAFDPFYYGI